MVSALDAGSSSPGWSPGGGTALCSWARYFTLIVPLSTQVYKWVLVGTGESLKQNDSFLVVKLQQCRQSLTKPDKD